MTSFQRVKHGKWGGGRGQIEYLTNTTSDRQPLNIAVIRHVDGMYPDIK